MAKEGDFSPFYSPNKEIYQPTAQNRTAGTRKGKNGRSCFAGCPAFSDKWGKRGFCYRRITINIPPAELPT